MFLLDPEAAGAFPRRRPRVGFRRCGKGRKVALDLSVAVGLRVGEGGIPPLCRALSCGMLRAHGPGSVRGASRGARGARPTAPGLGRELPSELRGTYGTRPRRGC